MSQKLHYLKWETDAKIDEVTKHVNNIVDNGLEGISNVTITPDMTSEYLNTLPNSIYRIQSKGIYNFIVSKPVEGVSVIDGKSVIEEGYDVKVIKLGTVWEVASIVNISKNVLSDLKESIDFTSLKLDNVISETMDSYINYIDSTLFEAGYLLETGAYHTSTNWIKIPYQEVPNELKGKEVTLQGLGRVNSGGLVIAIRDSNNELIFSIKGEGASTPLSYTFTIPLNASKWAFTIVNDPSDGGIGTRPHDNPFVNTFQLTIGSDVKDFTPFDRAKLFIKASKIKDANTIKFSNDIEEGNNGAVPSWKIKEFQDKILDLTLESPNLINYLTDFEAGRWTTAGVAQATLNSLRTKKINIPQNIIDIISKEDYEEDLEITVSGGGAVPSSGALLVLFDANDVVIRTIDTSSTPLFPFTFSLLSNATKWAFTIANDATDGGIGTRPINNPYINTFQVEVGSTPTAFKKFGELYIDSDKISYKEGLTNFNTREVVVKKVSNTQINIFYHIGGANNKWFRIIYFRQTNLDRFIDVWRLNEGYICTRLSEFEFSDVHQVINTGVYENAIYTSGYGYTNALGSAHGWEMLLNNTIFLDGKEINISDSWDILKGIEFFATTRTNFKSPDGTSNVAQSDKIWRIRDGVLNIQNNIKWFEQINILDNSYISMCSVFRRNNQGIQVTYKGTSNENLEVFDITEPGFTSTIYSDRNNPNRTSLIAWGDFFKVQMTMKEKSLIRDNVKSVNTSSGMNIQNVADPNYNKLYGRFGSMTTQIEDIWNIETEYIFLNV